VPADRIPILVNEPDIFEAVDFRAYPEIGEVFFKDDRFDPECIGALLIGLEQIIDDGFLLPFSNLGYIVSPTTGTDHIRTSRKVTVVHLDPAEILEVTATAEFTLALLLSLVRKIPFVDPHAGLGRRDYRGTQLRGKTLGIFGMGRLGSRMARYAEALEMACLGYDLGSTPADKRRLLNESDIISVHLPLRPETVDFLSGPEFELMARKPYLINTSRPQIVNQPALVHALESRRISGAAMDFQNYDGGNRWDEALMRYRSDRLIMTPHIAGNTHESIAFTSKVVVNKLARLLQRP
jgi:phosphoglycerate dehydrogenase-like enzyme